MGYPPRQHGPYGHLHQPPYGPGGHPPQSDHFSPFTDTNVALIVLLAIGVPLLLIGGGASVAMVLTDTGGSQAVTESEPNMIMPSRESLLADSPPPAQDALGRPAQEGAGQSPAGQVAQDPAGQPLGEQTGQTGQTGQYLTSQPPTVQTGQPPTTETGQGSSTARVGGSITLEGRDPGLRMTVTLNQLVNPATPADDFLKPKTGNKYVAVQVTLVNAGQAVYGDSPMLGAVLIDGQGQQYRPTFGEIREGQSFAGSHATINVGDTRMGMIVFEVPQAAALAKFQFGLDSGFTDRKGEWTLS